MPIVADFINNINLFKIEIILGKTSVSHTSRDTGYRE